MNRPPSECPQFDVEAAASPQSPNRSCASSDAIADRPAIRSFASKLRTRLTNSSNALNSLLANSARSCADFDTTESRLLSSPNSTLNETFASNSSRLGAAHSSTQLSFAPHSSVSNSTSLCVLPLSGLKHTDYNNNSSDNGNDSSCTRKSIVKSIAESTASSDRELLPRKSQVKLNLPPHIQQDLLAHRRHAASRPSVAGVGGTITTVTKSKRKTAPLPRLVSKNGTVNLFVNNIDRTQYMRDLFTTMIDIKWRYNLLFAAFGFVFSWMLFACIWYLVLLFHGDLDLHPEGKKWNPCIENVDSFPAAVLFSIEIQSTIGFGTRIISVECPHAIVIFCIQLIFGVVAECLIVGMVFAKLSRPAKRSQTIMFSKCATVCLRGGKMCIAFRVGDVRSKSHIIGATIRASLVSQKVTDEGEVIPFYHHDLQVKIDDSKNNLLLIWPVIVVHVIDESSPFYSMNCTQFANFNFEIITILEGTVESTGQSIQVRSSYLPSEVKWGFRFEPIVSTHGFGKYAQTIIDYNKFNRILAIDTPICSAREFSRRQLAASPLSLTSSAATTSNTHNNCTNPSSSLSTSSINYATNTGNNNIDISLTALQTNASLTRSNSQLIRRSTINIPDDALLTTSCLINRVT